MGDQIRASSSSGSVRSAAWTERTAPDSSTTVAGIGSAITETARRSAGRARARSSTAAAAAPAPASSAARRAIIAIPRPAGPVEEAFVPSGRNLAHCV